MADRTGQLLMALHSSCRGNPSREQILRDWISFAESRNEVSLLQSLPKTPKGAIIDWIRLYEEVVARGGFLHVSLEKLWPQIISKEVMNLDCMPYVIATYYQRYLFPFETKQVFPSSVSHGKRKIDDNMETIASASELIEAASGRGTPLPPMSKRVKAQQQRQYDLGSMQGIVLGLDSNIENEVHRSINLLSVLSYGNPNSSDGDVMVDNIPGLLDALYRQLHACKLLPYHRLLSAYKSHLLNYSNLHHQRELQDSKGLLVLNILRNLSMIGENEKSIAGHEDLCVFLILALRCFMIPKYSRRMIEKEIADHALDILCNIVRRINVYALNPPVPNADLKLRSHQDQPLSVVLWEQDKMRPLECLLQVLSHLIQSKSSKRSIILRACELWSEIGRDVAIRCEIEESKVVHENGLINRLVQLLATSRDDFLRARTKNRMDHNTMGVIGDMSSEEEDTDVDQDIEGISKWPAPWESDGYPSGIGMGVVYAGPSGSSVGISSGLTFSQQDEEKLDHEMRDAALEVVHRLSEVDDAAKLQLARHPMCLKRLASILTSCVGRAEAPRIAVATLSSISMHRETFPYYLPIEKQLLLVACSDRSLSDILNNVVADVYGMHSL